MKESYLTQRLQDSEDQRVRLLTANEELRHEIVKLRNIVERMRRDKIIKHGLTAYQTHACRCVICSEANRKYQKEYRERVKRRSTDDNLSGL